MAAAHATSLTRIPMNINDLPTELLIQILSQVSSDTPWQMVTLGLVCRSWYAVTKYSPAFWANVVANAWQFPSAPIAGSVPSRICFLDTYATALERSLPFYFSASLDISQVLTYYPAAGALKRTLLSTLAPHSQRLVSLSLVLAPEEHMQECHDFLKLPLPVLEEVSLTTLTALSFPNNSMNIAIPLPAPDDLAYRSLPPCALPRLHTLHVNGTFFGPWLARPTLKHLHISGSDTFSDRVPTHGMLLGGLQACPALETLDIDTALPVWTTMPYDVSLVDEWPHAHALQNLRRCTVRDAHEWTPKFIQFLYAAPLPAATMLYITLGPSTNLMSLADRDGFRDRIPADPQMWFSRDLCALAFSHQPHPIRMELNKHALWGEAAPTISRASGVAAPHALRVHAGDKKRLELTFSPALLAQFRARFGLTFAEALIMQIAVDPPLARMFDDSALRPNIDELVLDLGARAPAPLWWRLFFRFFGHVRRLVVRAHDASALFGALNGKPDPEECPLGRNAGEEELLRYVRAQFLPAEEFVEEFVLLGVDMRFQGSEEEELARLILGAFARRKAAGCRVPREFTLRYRGVPRPAFDERVKCGLEGLVRCVVVGSS
ncbi:hypothetical protein L227DRAFT_610497 [Lentinus tigrinus ALCF2SS1-6]|uniref:F-box domain-containing protein n=1 Tax=Lentinus tigrinus ALCF2SS1-6 TaxID=1328759 RepID=A0A5C2SE11_9APHY|nr:hypothetical protein L227DRAFT_610497 [Lentinus tigrinus ALCF2SS1-6]